VVGTRRCCHTVGCRYFQIRSLGKYLLEVDREVPAGKVCLMKHDLIVREIAATVNINSIDKSR
jgi:hypothetical protein